MKVLMFGWEYPPYVTGGLGTACHGLTKALSDHGHVKISFVVPKVNPGDQSDYVKLLGANQVKLGILKRNYSRLLRKIKLIEVNSNLIPYKSPKEYDELIKSGKISKPQKIPIQTRFGKWLTLFGEYKGNLFQEAANYAIAGYKIAKKNKFDIIHAHDWLAFPAAIAAKEARKKPLLIHVHSTEFDRSGGNINKSIYEIEKLGVQEADKIITVSNFTKSILIKHYGADPKKIITIYNAVEPVEREIIKKRKGISDKVVTFLGRITYQKGPQYFLDAAHIILKKHQNVRFIMAGMGELLGEMAKKVAHRQIEDRFQITGHLERDEVFELFTMSDAYVMPSVSEPFGITPLEAMLFEVPVIISKQSGVAEILKNVIKVNYWDTHSLSMAIEKVLFHKPTRTRLIKKGRAEAQLHKWEIVAEEVYQVYTSLLNKN
jgi:glycosyltransferase involved in cell wall biosynthesis